MGLQWTRGCVPLLFVLLGTAGAFEVALFASSGCYSHDVMMREVGEQFAGNNVTWLQAYLFEFGFGEMKIPPDWGRVQVTRTLDNVNEMNQMGGYLVWLGNVPLHWSRWYDIRGAAFFLEILKYHQYFCADFVKSPQFLKYKAEKSVDLLVIDHFLQECMTGAASLLNATTVQFSNWPIADGYISSLNVPANPASTPKTGNGFSSTHTMDFGTRVQNTIFHALIVLARTVQRAVIRFVYSEWGYDNLDIIDVEAKHIFYASRGEFLAEPVRPINNRIRFFGCSRCGDPEEYRVRRPAGYGTTAAAQSALPPAAAHFSLPRNASQVVVEGGRRCATCAAGRPTTAHALAPNGSQLAAMEARWLRLRHHDHPDLDWDLLEEKPFVLVSFGSVAHAKYMPDALFDRFLEEFGRSPYTIIWQTNDVTEKLRTRRPPANLRIVRWVPMKVLLAHHNLHYAMLHCGVNTVNELLSFGVPILAVPMQGDQPSNAQRLKDLGLADSASIADFWTPGGLATVMRRFDRHLTRRRRRAQLVRRMVAHYRSLHRADQAFWLQWAQRHGKRLRHARQRFFDTAYRDALAYYALPDCVLYAAVLALLSLVAACL